MSAAALRTRPPARTNRDNHSLVPNPAFPRIAPRAELTGVTRTAKCTPSQELVDLERVRTYDQQRVPPSTKRRPFLPAKERGGPLRFHDVVTLSSPTKKGNPPGRP